MEIYFSFQAALCFSIAHILIRRGLVESNALTGSFISLSISAVVSWALVAFFVSPSEIRIPALKSRLEPKSLTRLFFGERRV